MRSAATLADLLDAVEDVAEARMRIIELVDELIEEHGVRGTARLIGTSTTTVRGVRDREQVSLIAFERVRVHLTETWPEL